MISTQHPFRVGDKVRFNKGSSVFNQRFLSRFFDDCEGVVTVTDAVTEKDQCGDITHYVRLAEDAEPINDEGDAPIWNVNWFETEPVTTTAQEAPMSNNTFPVGSKVRVTDERTIIGTSGLPAGATYVGATATVIQVLNEDDNEYDGSYSLEFDDKNLSGFGSWSQEALDLVEEPPARPTIDFSGSSRSTAREYAKDANSRLLTPPQQALLKRVAKGETVDAYALNEVLLAAMRAATTRHGASTQRRVTGRKIAYLGHITQAVLENHADGLPAYQTGERSRILAEVKPALVEAEQEVGRLTQKVGELNVERGLLTQAASDERRRLCEEIDTLRAERDHAVQREEVTLQVASERDSLLSETVTERDNVALVLDYALGLLDDTQKQRVLGYWDGVDQSRVDGGE